MMSDSLFSLIILVYVSVTFCIVFFLFCWKATNGRNGQLDFKQQCPLMTNEIRVKIFSIDQLFLSNFGLHRVLAKVIENKG